MRGYLKRVLREGSDIRASASALAGHRRFDFTYFLTIRENDFDAFDGARTLSFREREKEQALLNINPEQAPDFGTGSVEWVDFSPVSAKIKLKKAFLSRGVTVMSKAYHSHPTSTAAPGVLASSHLTSTLRFIAGCFVFALLVSAFCVGSSWAATDAPEDVKAYHSPYVWRTDGTGD
ncbi:MAG: hypothetical protein PHF12_08720, partial [Candidatus Omnitrophica bacterium]|nr:hypothetical protein [Candidatus Omnitrophota bacterium]